MTSSRSLPTRSHSPDLPPPGHNHHQLVWANFGLQQLHMPINEPINPAQRIRGWIELDYENLSSLLSRLETVSGTRRQMIHGLPP